MSFTLFIACTFIFSIHESHALKIQLRDCGNGKCEEDKPVGFSKQVFVPVDFDRKVEHYILDPHVIGGPHVTHTLSEDSSVPLGVWAANVVGALVVLGSLVAMSSLDEKSPLMGLIAILCYNSLSFLVDININVAGNGHGVRFEPAVSVFLVESGKLIVSLGLYTMNRWSALRDGETFLQDSFCTKDVAFLSLPGALYAINNVLGYLAIGYNDIASFGVFRDTVIFFNAMIWCFVFKSTLGMKRIGILLVIFAGLCINQIPPLLSATLSWSLLLILAMTLTNAFASVSTEYAIKQNSGLDLNMQNAVLYACSSMCALIYVAALHPEKLASSTAFFANFDSEAFFIVGVQLCIGLLVSRILKYADSLTKSVGSCLRGPTIIFLAPLIGLHSRLDILTGISAVIVASSATLFLMQGRPAPGIDLDNKAEKYDLKADQKL